MLLWLTACWTVASKPCGQNVPRAGAQPCAAAVRRARRAQHPLSRQTVVLVLGFFAPFAQMSSNYNGCWAGTLRPSTTKFRYSSSIFRVPAMLSAMPYLNRTCGQAIAVQSKHQCHVPAWRIAPQAVHEEVRAPVDLLAPHMARSIATMRAVSRKRASAPAEVVPSLRSKAQIGFPTRNIQFAGVLAMRKGVSKFRVHCVLGWQGL